MKALNHNLIFGFILCISAFSCDSDEGSTENNYNFHISFSDGSEITENNIYSYDSTTHILLLKNDLELGEQISGFDVLVNSDTIYSGILHSCNLSTPPPQTFSISDCNIYGKNVLEIDYYPYSSDLRNNPKIITAFEEGNLLRSGLTCEIDSIHVNTLENSSEVICKATITNLDNISYYILHPDNMGELDYNCYTGGFSLINIDTKVSSFFRWSVQNPDYANISMSDFYLLPGKSKVSFTFKSSDYRKMEKGYYNATFRFCGIKYGTGQLDLAQDNGWIWVGTLISRYDNIKVE